MRPGLDGSADGEIDVEEPALIHLYRRAFAIPADPLSSPGNAVCGVRQYIVGVVTVGRRRSTDQCQTFGPAAGVGLPAHQDQLRLPANRLSKIQCTGFAVSVCTCPGVGPHRDFRHRRPDGLQRRRGSLFRHLCGQRVQGRLVGFFCLRGGQTARKIIQSRVDLGVVLVEIGAFYMVVRLPLIE